MKNLKSYSKQEYTLTAVLPKTIIFIKCFKTLGEYIMPRNSKQRLKDTPTISDVMQPLYHQLLRMRKPENTLNVALPSVMLLP